MRINKIIKTKYKTKIKNIKTNSKDIKKGDVFVCALGNIDKKEYISDAIERGCSIVVANSEIEENASCIVVDNINLVLRNMLDRFYNFPLKKINLIGVTGTDGKTSITTMLKDMTNGACIGTNGFMFNDKVCSLKNTTPSLDKIYECINKSIKNGKKDIFMEVSSEAYLTKRIPNLFFDIGVFTNITKEHLDKHKDFDNYFKCKMKLLKNSGVVIINHDSKYFKKIKKVNSNYRTYGFKKSDITILDYRLYLERTYIKFNYENKDYNVVSPLIGVYNIYNLIASILVMIELGYKIEDIIKRIDLIKKIPGRNEIVYNKDYLVMIDHAHTKNSIKNILKFVRNFKKNRLIVVLGCAGGRYKEKRGKIGKLALKYADITIFTSDDPRDEDPNKIIDDMLNGNCLFNKKYYRIIDRKMALKKAIKLVEEDDIILVLGRGRDNIMHLNGYDIEFNDYIELKKLIM